MFACVMYVDLMIILRIIITSFTTSSFLSFYTEIAVVNLNMVDLCVSLEVI